MNKQAVHKPTGLVKKTDVSPKAMVKYGNYIDDPVIKAENCRTYLSDYDEVFSNLIYKNSHTPNLKLLGDLGNIETGQVLKFLDYETVMNKIRYLNKSFIMYTEEYLDYIEGMERKAVIKTSLKELYSGEMHMPMLNHAYYAKCTSLAVYYEKSTAGCFNDTSDLDLRFLTDLFGIKPLFPELRELKIVVSASLA
jgi:hypothetical protein